MRSATTLMDVREVADALRVSPYTVRRWAAHGKLHKIKLGSRTLFDPDDVSRFVEEARKASIAESSLTATKSRTDESDANSQ